MKVIGDHGELVSSFTDCELDAMVKRKSRWEDDAMSQSGIASCVLFAPNGDEFLGPFLLGIACFRSPLRGTK